MWRCKKNKTKKKQNLRAKVKTKKEDKYKQTQLRDSESLADYPLKIDTGLAHCTASDKTTLLFNISASLLSLSAGCEVCVRQSVWDVPAIPCPNQRRVTNL